MNHIKKFEKTENFSCFMGKLRIYYIRLRKNRKGLDYE